MGLRERRLENEDLINGAGREKRREGPKNMKDVRRDKECKRARESPSKVQTRVKYSDRIGCAKGKKNRLTKEEVNFLYLIRLIMRLNEDAFHEWGGLFYFGKKI